LIVDEDYKANTLDEKEEKIKDLAQKNPLINYCNEIFTNAI